MHLHFIGGPYQSTLMSCAQKPLALTRPPQLCGCLKAIIPGACAGEGTYQSYLSQGAPVPAYSGRALAPTVISAAEVGYVTQSGPGLAPSAVSYQEITGPG